MQLVIIFMQIKISLVMDQLIQETTKSAEEDSVHEGANECSETGTEVSFTFLITRVMPSSKCFHLAHPWTRDNKHSPDLDLSITETWYDN